MNLFSFAVSCYLPCGHIIDVKSLTLDAKSQKWEENRKGIAPRKEGRRAEMAER